MNEKLTHLISDYQEKIMEAIIVMQKSGIRRPFSITGWIKADIPCIGKLDGGGQYFKHGAGCEVCFDTNKVDFDFGKRGEIGGFNEWWLTEFAGDKLTDYGFSSKAEVTECLENAFNTQELTYSNDGLYYIANVPRILAVDIDYRLPGDMLPDRNHDRILVLHSHYFQNAAYMLELYEKPIKKKNKANYLDKGCKVDQHNCLRNWLGFLGVTCEGFKKLNMRFLLEKNRPESFKELIPVLDDIGKKMKKHFNLLRKFRNDVFHLRENLEVVRQFFDHDADLVLWSREIHAALAKFFSMYRVLCEVHYTTHKRDGESDLFKQRMHRKQSSPQK